MKVCESEQSRRMNFPILIPVASALVGKDSKVRKRGDSLFLTAVCSFSFIGGLDG